jgi:hypothetical protein
MKRNGTVKCPYCGDRLNYAKAWTLKRRGEYICPKCGGLSNVQLAPPIYTIGFFAILLGLACFVVGVIFDTSLALFTLGGIFVIFTLFFLLSPLFVRLRKPAPPKPPAQRRPAPPRTSPPRQ